MPALYSLAQHPALEEVCGQLAEGEAIFAYLDDLYVVAAPERVRPVYNLLQDALWRHACVQLHASKTRIWNAAGEEPAQVADLQPEDADPVWVGAWTLPPELQGMMVLGSPLGSDEYVQRQLQQKRDDQDRLLPRIPRMPDLQAAWLLLLFCAAPRCNYLLRMLPPALTQAYAEAHDAAIRRCLSALLLQDADQQLPATPAEVASLPLRLGGLGLHSATRTRQSAYWASWCDALPVMPEVADRLLQALNRGGVGAHSLLSASQAAAQLRDLGVRVPAWDEVMTGPAPRQPQPHPSEPGDFRRGWQRHADHVCDQRALEMLLPHLDPASRALLLSQAGPYGGRVFTVLPTSRDFDVPCAQFRVLLLRRLRLPLPLAPRACTCRGRLDQLGDHRAACANSGVLASRALPLERALARVCQEAGARVVRNMRLADMNITVPVSDERRIEVVANGLPLWHGSQLAIDATMVSPVTRAGEAQAGAAERPGRALHNAVLRKRRAYPELARAHRCRAEKNVGKKEKLLEGEAIALLAQATSLRAPDDVVAFSRLPAFSKPGQGARTRSHASAPHRPPPQVLPGGGPGRMTCGFASAQNHENTGAASPTYGPRAGRRLGRASPRGAQKSPR